MNCLFFIYNIIIQLLWCKMLALPVDYPFHLFDDGSLFVPVRTRAKCSILSGRRRQEKWRNRGNVICFIQRSYIILPGIVNSEVMINLPDGYLSDDSFKRLHLPLLARSIEKKGRDWYPGHTQKNDYTRWIYCRWPELSQTPSRCIYPQASRLNLKSLASVCI